ncbi:hypothetical protein NLG97_g11080 [Lecanicillium saksenae]|uniref:Uncharacterized protein n=1 Tax=Lecanicillium saksenae TaxID=468837 RepID=A0ACC1QD68_9HYPO|nr:hypothetical protein NLG97_g11080 [Lecanicillium saksenae]
MTHLQQSLNSSSVAETLATYDQWADTYNQDVESEGYTAPQLASDYVSKYLNAAAIASARILDAGCGTGLVGQHLAKRGARRIDGVDLSPGMLEVARKTGAYESLTTGDLSQWLDVDSAVYDALTCVGTLTQGHLGPGALDQLLRVVKPGGLVVATVRDTVWEMNGYKEKVKTFIADGRAHLVTDDFCVHRVAKDVNLIYVVLRLQ